MARRTGYDFLDEARFQAFAHRGAHEDAGENTSEAFEAARRLGYRFIETDARASRDGVAVLSHDEEFGEDLVGIAGRDWSELAQLRTRRGEALPRLDDVLGAFPDTRFNIDAKTDAAVEPLAEAIARCGAAGRVCVASFDVRRTLRLRRLLGDEVCWSPGRGAVLSLWLAGWGVPLQGARAPVVQVPPAYLRIPVATRRFVAAAHARGTKVHVWTIDEQSEMERLIEDGVDGLMTDRPRLLKSVLQRRGLWIA